MFPFRVVHFDFRRISCLREIRRQLRCFYENRIVERFILAGIADDHVRSTVLGHVKPEIFRSRDVEGQFVVFPRSFSN